MPCTVSARTGDFRCHCSGQRAMELTSEETKYITSRRDSISESTANMEHNVDENIHAEQFISSLRPMLQEHCRSNLNMGLDVSRQIEID